MHHIIPCLFSKFAHKLPRYIRKTLEKKFTHRFEAKIWSIGHWGNPVQAKLWIETRTDQHPQWYSLDLGSESLVALQTPTYPLQWLTGFEKLGIFIALRSEKNPGVESIEAIDLSTGQQLYKLPISQWTSLTGTFLQTNRGNIDLRTGEYTTLVPTDTKPMHIQSPQHFEESQAGFDAFRTLFQQKFQENIRKGIDYWEGANKLIFSYYLYEQTAKNQLRICDHAFNTLFLETINEGELIGYHTFQIEGNRLFFVKDKRELHIYEIN